MKTGIYWQDPKYAVGSVRGATDPSLVLDLPLYKLDGAAFMSKDAYGHLCTVNGALWTPRGRSFDGSDDYIDAHLSTDLSGSGDFTAEVWVKAADSAQGYAMSQSHALDPYASDWIMMLNQTTSLLWMRSVALAAPTGFDGTRWNHLAMVWEKAVGKYKGYINGELLGQSGTVEGYGGVSSVKIGASGDATTGFFGGLIDEVRICNRALTPLEIMRHFLATKWRYR